MFLNDYSSGVSLKATEVIVSIAQPEVPIFDFQGGRLSLGESSIVGPLKIENGAILWFWGTIESSVFVNDIVCVNSAVYKGLYASYITFANSGCQYSEVPCKVGPLFC